jgi:hypothetical protein
VEDGGAIAFEVAAGALQGGGGGVEATEVVVEGGDDAVLFGEGGYQEWKGLEYGLTDILLGSTLAQMVKLRPLRH